MPLTEPSWEGRARCDAPARQRSEGGTGVLWHTQPRSFAPPDAGARRSGRRSAASLPKRIFVKGISRQIREINVKVLSSWPINDSTSIRRLHRSEEHTS